MNATYGYDYANAASGTGSVSLLATLFSGTYLLVMLALAVLSVIAYWRIFTKAGEPGWGCIVPFYGQYLLFKIAWGNGWLFLLMFVPVVNVVVYLIALYKLCAAFGYGIGFFIGMLFLTPIFLMIMAFGPSEYYGPA